MEQIFNPYLPLTEYIPDGEPHVFGDRVYIYGSHDQAQGQKYCEGHYEVWSAPVDNLKDWRSEGTSYLRTQDPSNADDRMQLWAPDVTCGPDGRYYLYYCFSFYPEIGVAVADHPAGPFTFYGHVHYPSSIMDGKVVSEHMVFDPAVLTDDDGRVFLYYGFCPAAEKEPDKLQSNSKDAEKLTPEERERAEKFSRIQFGEYSMVVELEQDMVTTKGEPRPLIPGGHHTEGTGFEGHGFFEASSIRKINGKYYFVYSSHKSHELCYAISDKPDSGFVYGGTIVSNGNIGLNGREHPTYPLGNNHGGIVQIGSDFYIFYHRQTNGTEFSRQGCAEKIRIGEDGTIRQVQTSSCGLNGGALRAAGSYPAAIACHLTDPTVVNKIDYSNPAMKQQIQVTEHQNQTFITNIRDKAVIGYRDFGFIDSDLLAVEIRGSFAGSIIVAHDADGKAPIGEYEVQVNSDEWDMQLIPIAPAPGVHGMYLIFSGTGMMEFKSFAFISA